MDDDTRKLEVHVDDEWKLTIALNDESIDRLFRYAEILQHHEVEGLDIDEIEDAISDAYERAGF
jgi:hypothetical protein